MKANCKVLLLRTNNPGHQCIMGIDHLEGALGLGVLANTKPTVIQQCALLWQGRTTGSLSCCERGGQEVERGDPAPLLSTCEA